MKIIRNKVFETNSSSTHAIAITKSNENLDTPKYISLEYDGEYGWSFRVVNDLDNKFTYLAIAAAYIEDISHGGDRDEFFKVPGDIKAREFEIRYFLWKLKKLGFSFGDREDKIVKKLTDENSYDYYIDHCDGAVGIYLDLVDNDDKLKRFLLSSDSFITMGNDNDDRDIWDEPNRRFDLGLKSYETEWGTTRYNEDQLNDRFEIYYKGN